MRPSTNRRAVACAALALSACATAAAVVAALGASASEPPAAQAAPERQRPAHVRTGDVRIAWAGDTMLGTATAVPPAGGDELFAHVRRPLRAADLVFVNLEGVLAATGVSKCGAQPGPSCFAFRAPPSSASALRRAGVDIVNLANNHTWDYGAAGQAATIAALGAGRVAWTGPPGRVVVRRAGGTRVAFVGFAPYPWAAPMLDTAAAQALVRRAASLADVVVAAFHGGAEGAAQTRTPVGREVAFGEDRGDTRAFAHALVDAGADLVVGSGPHVLRGIERHRGRLIAYSLGNFAGWHNFGTGGVLRLSGLLDVTLDRRGRPLRGRLQPMAIAPPGVPAPDPTGAAARLVDDVSRADFGPGAVRVAADGRLRLRLR
jgi:hypothetical protein